MNIALDKSKEDSDFHTCKQILVLGSTFCIQAEEVGFEFIRVRNFDHEDNVQTQLTKSSVWGKLEFWIYAFNGIL